LDDGSNKGRFDDESNEEKPTKDDNVFLFMVLNGLENI
jgi:hypothetical protein